MQVRLDESSQSGQPPLDAEAPVHVPPAMPTSPPLSLEPLPGAAAQTIPHAVAQATPVVPRDAVQQDVGDTPTPSLQMSQVPSSQQLLPVDQSSQQLLAQAEAALHAAAQLSAEPSISPSEISSGSDAMEGTLLAMLSELLQAARATGVAGNADEQPADLQEQLQQLGARAAGMQTEAVHAAVRSSSAQAAAPLGTSSGVQASHRSAAATETQAHDPVTVSAIAQTASAGRRQRLTRPQVQQEMSSTFSAIWEPVHPGVPTADVATQDALVTHGPAAQPQGLIAAQVRNEQPQAQDSTPTGHLACKRVGRHVCSWHQLHLLCVCWHYETLSKMLAGVWPY